MPRDRNLIDPSVPTLLIWFRRYLTATHKAYRAGKMDELTARKVVKGLKYAIKALEENNVRYKAEKRRLEAEKYAEAVEELG